MFLFRVGNAASFRFASLPLCDNMLTLGLFGYPVSSWFVFCHVGLRSCCLFSGTEGTAVSFGGSCIFACVPWSVHEGIASMHICEVGAMHDAGSRIKLFDAVAVLSMQGGYCRPSSSDLMIVGSATRLSDL